MTGNSGTEGITPEEYERLCRLLGITIVPAGDDQPAEKPPPPGGE